MKIQLRITPNEGEPYELETNLFVIVAWERKFKQKASTLANGIGIEDLAFMAYECCKQNKVRFNKCKHMIYDTGNNHITVMVNRFDNYVETVDSLLL